MLAATAALIFAHVLADFVAQTRAMVADKHRPAILARHLLIVVVTAWACLGFSAAGLAATAVVVVSHAALDTLKLRFARSRMIQRHAFGGLGLFGADQIGHLLFIGIAASLWPRAFAEGLWPAALGASGAAWLAAAFAVAAGLIVATRVGDLVVAELLAGFRRARAQATPDSERAADERPTADGLHAGAWIGFLERALVFLLVLLGQFNAIGFVIAAKSILRFEYARKPHQSEFVIIGTLASFGWAIVIALVTSAALAGLRPDG